LVSGIRKIIKIIATRCHTVRLKCTNFDSGLQHFLHPLAGLRGPTSKAREGGEGKEKERRERGDGKREGRGRFTLLT